MSKTNSIKWRSMLGLILMYVGLWFNWQWMWGILFFIWVIPDLFTGVTYFMEPVERKENPILYWIIVLSWLLMSAYLVAMLFIPELKYYQ